MTLRIALLLAVVLMWSGVAAADAPPTAESLQRQLAEKDHRIAQLESALATRGADETSPAAGGSLWERVIAKFRKMAPITLIGWVWFIIGFGGEFIFFLRFVVQWIASERKKRTVVPMAFWHLSLIGTGLVLAYALYKLDPVFILAYSLNIFIYVRNLTIARRNPAQETVMEKESE